MGKFKHLRGIYLVKDACFFLCVRVNVDPPKWGKMEG
jgi:hypothetical protein